jgi:[acyl-carrier-protein] S-malonyltransferase
VQARAAAMQQAAEDTTGYMLTVVGLDDDVLNEMCAAAVRECSAVAAAEQQTSLSSTNETTFRVQISNYLFPRGRVIAGDTAAVDHVRAACKQAGRRVITKPLSVSGAFHTEVMRPAERAVVKALQSVTINLPTIPVVSNVSGLPYTTVDEIRQGLARQVVEPVKWQQSVEYILAMGKGATNAGAVGDADERTMVTLYDMGPQSQLKAMVRKINADAWKLCVSVTV